MKETLSREEIVTKLESYVKSKISLKQLQEWAESIYPFNGNYDDCEGDNSFSNEVMARIEMSDIDGLSKEKVQEIIKLLRSNEPYTYLTKHLYALK